MQFLQKRPLFLHVDLNQAEPRHFELLCGTVESVFFSLTDHQFDDGNVVSQTMVVSYLIFVTKATRILV